MPGRGAAGQWTPTGSGSPVSSFCTSNFLHQILLFIIFLHGTSIFSHLSDIITYAEMYSSAPCNVFPSFELFLKTISLVLKVSCKWFGCIFDLAGGAGVPKGRSGDWARPSGATAEGTGQDEAASSGDL